jgi:hypothetical protein
LKWFFGSAAIFRLKREKKAVALEAIAAAV